MLSEVEGASWSINFINSSTNFRAASDVRPEESSHK
jgi:hypothetical protein